MAENPITAEGIFTQLYTNFPSVQTTAVTHLEANGGDHFFLALIRAEPTEDGQKQQQTGDSPGSKQVPKPKRKPRKTVREDQSDDPRDKLYSALNRHLINLLQEPLDWRVFGEKDKQQATGT